MTNSTFVQYERKSATEKLMEALFLRGFFLKEEKGFLSLKNGSDKDIQELKWLLNQCAVPVIWNGNKFQLLVNHLPTEKVSEIVHFKGRNHLVGMEGYHFKWRSFVNRRYGIRISTVTNCPYTAVLAKALNVAGIVTLCGCNGHGKHQPNFLLSGVYNGMWFSIIQEKYLANLPLHYRWEIEFNSKNNATYLLAKKQTDELWDMLEILPDCEVMANQLLKHAEEIRVLKKQCFKRSMKETAEAMRTAGDLKALYNWMKNKVDENIAHQVSHA